MNKEKKKEERKDRILDLRFWIYDFGFTRSVHPSSFFFTLHPLIL